MPSDFLQLAGKRILVMGVANDKSIAWGIASQLAKQGAELAFTYQGDRAKDRVIEFAKEFGTDIALPCDVASDEEIAAVFTELAKKWDGLDGLVHSIAFAPKQALAGDYLESVTRENFRIAHDISSYSFAALAKAGLERLEVDCEAFVLDPTIFIPAVGQGAIAISCANGSKHFETLSALNDTETRLCVEAERYVLAGMGGGCSVPIGIWAVKKLDALRVRGIVLADDGSRAFRLDRHLDVENLKVGLDRFVKEMMKGWEGIR